MRYTLSSYGASKFEIIDTDARPVAKSVLILDGQIYNAYQALDIFNGNYRASRRRWIIKRQLKAAGVEIHSTLLLDLHGLRALRKSNCI